MAANAKTESIQMLLNTILFYALYCNISVLYVFRTVNMFMLNANVFFAAGMLITSDITYCVNCIEYLEHTMAIQLRLKLIRIPLWISAPSLPPSPSSSTFPPLSELFHRYTSWLFHQRPMRWLRWRCCRRRRTPPPSRPRSWRRTGGTGSALEGGDLGPCPRRPSRYV